MICYPKISILIPLYNVEQYVTRCLCSVGEQTYQGEIECIIIDDCGKDNSLFLVKSFVEKYTGSVKFKILHHSYNRGLAAARNTAIEHATGEFVVHVDSDDWIEPNAIELLVKCQLETNADIVSCNAIAHYPKGRTELLIEPKYETIDDMVMQTIQLTLDHVIWRRLIRRSLYTNNDIRAVEGVNIGEDHHTLPRLVACADTFACVDDFLWHYNCENQNSYMQQSRGFNYKRYCSDMSSIDILLSYFENTQKYYEELQKIKMCYINSSLKMAINANDREKYNKILKDFLFVPKEYWHYVSLNKLWRFFMVKNYYIHKIKQLIFNN